MTYEQFFGGPRDMCPCEPLPVNRMYRGGEMVIAVEIGPASADEDAALYGTLRCDCWEIVCPECGRMYATGTTTP